jgi:hypothetical protein
VAASYLIFALQCLLPIFDMGVGEYLGLSIVNPEAQPREYTITATPQTGANAQIGRVMLNPGAQQAFLLNEILGGVPPSSGWIRIDSAAIGCMSYLASGNDEFLAGTDAAASSSTALVLPHISVNTGFVELDHTDTMISIVNAGIAPASVAAQLVGLDGVIIGTLSMTVPANGSRTGRMSELYRDVLPNNSLGGKKFDGYLRLSADVPISAWQRIDTPLSRSMLRGRSLPSELSNAIIPHFVTGGENLYESIVNLVNPGPASSVFELRAIDDRGNSLGEVVQMTLRAGEAKRMSVGALFRIVTILTFPPPLMTGHISIRPLPTVGPALQQLVGSVEIVGGNQIGKAASLLYPVSPSNVSRWIIPFAVTSPPYFTGYAVANANELLTVQNDVQVEVLNSAGALISKSDLSLSPGTRQVALIPPGLSSGYVRFTATMPIYVMGIIGTSNSRILDQIPAIPQYRLVASLVKTVVVRRTEHGCERLPKSANVRLDFMRFESLRVTPCRKDREVVRTRNFLIHVIPNVAFVLPTFFRDSFEQGLGLLSARGRDVNMRHY